jgi:hypothetical protein
MQQLGHVVERLREPGLSHADIERLIWLKTRVERGTCSEFPMEHERLLFARYLCEHQLIHD